MIWPLSRDVCAGATLTRRPPRDDAGNVVAARIMPCEAALRIVTLAGDAAAQGRVEGHGMFVNAGAVLWGRNRLAPCLQAASARISGVQGMAETPFA